MVKGKEGDTVAFRHNELGIPFSEVEAAGGEKKSTRFGKKTYQASHFPPEVFRGEVGGKSWEVIRTYQFCSCSIIILSIADLGE